MSGQEAEPRPRPPLLLLPDQPGGVPQPGAGLVPGPRPRQLRAVPVHLAVHGHASLGHRAAARNRPLLRYCEVNKAASFGTQ